MPDSVIRSLTTEYGFVLQDVWNAELAKWTVRRSRGSGEAQSVLANGSKGCRGDDASCDNDTFSERKPIKRRWCKSNVSYEPGNYLQDIFYMECLSTNAYLWGYYAQTGLCWQILLWIFIKEEIGGGGGGREETSKICYPIGMAETIIEKGTDHGG